MSSQASSAAAPNSAENPWPVRAVAVRVAGWIDKLGMVWVEGQLTEVKVRPDSKTVFMVLRDPAADMSLSITCPRDLVRNAPVKLSEGTQVIVHGKPNFFTGRGSFSLRVSEIRAVGVGELLARIERMRRLLAAEGLFDARLKRPIPFLPGTVGLITGRASAAERDVMTVAGGRWPAVRFAVRNTAVQGPNAVAQIVEALRELDADPDVDVIVVARGGGSVEDLLPFSDETLCRAIAACTTPVISAVGHEPDNPVCDLVADLRAATPTDAAKRLVPDAAAERALVVDLRRRSARALRNWVHREEHLVTQLRSRPVLAGPLQALRARSDEIHRARTAVRRDISRLVSAEADRVEHLAARLAALGPAATLARGYAVVQTIPDSGTPAVLRSVHDAPAGTPIRIRVSDGAVGAVSSGAETGEERGE
ncbi:MAG: xseA [Mycobacterium sp.]|nr:xseA [Mycobacterium sp.]